MSDLRLCVGNTMVKWSSSSTWSPFHFHPTAVPDIPHWYPTTETDPIEKLDEPFMNLLHYSTDILTDHKDTFLPKTQVLISRQWHIPWPLFISFSRLLSQLWRCWRSFFFSPGESKSSKTRRTGGIWPPRLLCSFIGLFLYPRSWYHNMDPGQKAKQNPARQTSSSLLQLDRLCLLSSLGLHSLDNNLSYVVSNGNLCVDNEDDMNNDAGWMSRDSKCVDLDIFG